MSNRVYDILKYTAMIALPAIGTLYGTIATIWGLPFGEPVTKTCSAVALCLGTLVGISAAKYRKENK